MLARLVSSDLVVEATEFLRELTLPFATTTTTHFATITILPEQYYGEEVLPATLLFATSYCGPVLAHVRELVSVMGTELREVFRFCAGFDADCSNTELELFILEHRHGDTFYSGMQHLSPADVRDHHVLHDEIGKFLDQRQTTGGFTGTALAIRHEIQAFVRSRPDLAWAEQPFTPPLRAFWALHWRSLILLAMIASFLAAIVVCTLARWFAHGSALGTVAPYLWITVGVIIAFFGGLILAVRESEREQTYVAARRPDAEVKALAATQNRRVINEMTVFGPIKSEAHLRPVFLRIALWIVARVAEGIPWTPLSGINIPTVATARWVAADRGRRLIFISNYTNSAEPYVRDFIDVDAGAMRINLVFGFGHGYPKTKWVVFDGAVTYPNEFIYVVTEGQKATSYWYGPYTDISIDNIKLDRKIREGLFERCDEDQAKAWLHLL